jgi:hypothetical protein
MAILIPKILRYSFIQAQCRQASWGFGGEKWRVIICKKSDIFFDKFK